MDRFCSAICAKSSHKPIKRTPVRKSVSHSNKSFSKVKMEMAEKIMDLDGYMSCQHCGITAKCDLHHIFYRSEVPNHEFLNDPVNLIFCCRDCHEWFHQSKDNRNKLVEERGLLQIFSEKTERYSKK